MIKLKRTCKKAKGLRVRLEREEFLDRLKNPAKYAKKRDESAEAILKRIRDMRKQVSPSPYDAGPGVPGTQWSND